MRICKNIHTHMCACAYGGCRKMCHGSMPLATSPQPRDTLQVAREGGGHLHRIPAEGVRLGAGHVNCCQGVPARSSEQRL